MSITHIFPERYILTITHNASQPYTCYTSHIYIPPHTPHTDIRDKHYVTFCDFASSHDDKHFLLSGSLRQTCAYLYDTQQRDFAMAIYGHSGPVTGVDWHPR
jgi:WD40 repeat protein